MFNNDEYYTVTFKGEVYWFWCNNAHLADVQNIDEEDVDMIHTIVCECDEAPFNRLIILPESFTGTAMEMAVVEHEIGHILAAHTYITIDESQIDREIEADSYVERSAELEKVLTYFSQIFSTELSNTYPNINFLRLCIEKRIEAFKLRMAN